MKNLVAIFVFTFALFTAASGQPDKYQSDVIKTSAGDLKIYFIGHASLMFEFNGKTIYTDPWSKLADYTKFPKADLILITHQHLDHLDPEAVLAISKKGTQIIETKPVYDVLVQGTVMKNGDKKTIDGMEIEAVPAYNTTEGREMYHPKGRDNGYIVTFGNKRVYIAGDTEDIPEMATFKNIDIAFLPMNQPYTMTPEQVAHAVQMIKPKIVYPYHTGDTDVSKLKALLANDKNVDLRIRKLQ